MSATRGPAVYSVKRWLMWIGIDGGPAADWIEDVRTKVARRCRLAYIFESVMKIVDDVAQGARRADVLTGLHM